MIGFETLQSASIFQNTWLIFDQSVLNHYERVKSYLDLQRVWTCKIRDLWILKQERAVMISRINKHKICQFYSQKKDIFPPKANISGKIIIFNHGIPHSFSWRPEHAVVWPSCSRQKLSSWNLRTFCCWSRWRRWWWCNRSWTRKVARQILCMLGDSGVPANYS